MNRPLVALIVVCLVAATGVRPAVAAAGEPQALSAPHKIEKLHARVAHASPQRRAFPHGAAAPELPAVVVADKLAIPPPAARPSDRLPDARVVVVCMSATCSARGPPID
jgi:hypothetical protein